MAIRWELPRLWRRKLVAQVLETSSPKSLRSDSILLLRACVTFVAVHRDHLHR